MRISPLLLIPLAACSAAEYANDADLQVYSILETASKHVTGQTKTFPIGRKENTLRQRLLETDETLVLDIPMALDIAAENSREFASQKENLYGAALNLTRAFHDFELQFGGGADGGVSGTGDDTASVDFSDDLRASVNTMSGGRIVFSFVNNFLKDVVNGGSWNGSSVMSLAITQPLLAGYGARIVREPLTQAERNVVYAVRSFERFRVDLSIDVVSQYFSIAQQMRDIESVKRQLIRSTDSRERSEKLFEAGREDINGLGQSRQSELDAEARVVTAINQLESQLDDFRQLLGLPTDAKVFVKTEALDQLQADGLVEVPLDEATAVALAMQRRFDLRTIYDRLEDAGRRVYVAEDALRSILDFSSVISVPTEPGKPFSFDWSQVSWSAGFNLDLALDRLAERNAYRSALINLDNAIRNREQEEDRIKDQIRTDLRNIESRRNTFNIQTAGVKLANSRFKSNQMLHEAGRIPIRDFIQAQEDLTSNEILLNNSLVQYVVARMNLMSDLEALTMEPKGLRFDTKLPLPTLEPVSAEEPPAPK